MSYGLYDADLQFYPIPFYNLELMKLSSYYKHKREIVGLSLDFSPNKYNHFIVRQDFYNPHVYYSNHKNVEYGGRAFDGKNYKPLSLEIEALSPDISLYERLKPKQVKGFTPGAISTMRRAEHIRLSLDGKTIWKDFEKQFRHSSNCFGVIFHDYNLNEIEGAYDLIINEMPSWIKRWDGRRVGMKFPIQVDNIDDFCKWISLNPMGSYFSLCYNGLIENQFIPMLAEKSQETTAKKQVSMDVSNNMSDIQRIYRTIINLRSYKLVFRLIYNESFLSNDWKKVMELISYYNQHLVGRQKTNFFKYTEPYETLYSYCKAAIKNHGVKNPFFNTETIQSVFQFVRENDYELFKDFYEYRGGEVRNDR